MAGDGVVLRPLILGLAVLVVFVLSCGGSSGPTRLEVTDGELVAMVFRAEDIPGSYSGYQMDEDVSGFISREDRLSYATDPVGERDILEQAGFIKGYTEHYTSNLALIRGRVFTIGTGASIYRDAEGASLDLNYAGRETERAAGLNDEGFMVKHVEHFATGKLGDEAAGYAVLASISTNELPGGVEAYITTVSFRRGRIVGGVVIEQLGRNDSRDEAIEVAQKLDERILSVLAGDEPERPTPTRRPEQVRVIF